jgi:hypothetical protein
MFFQKSFTSRSVKTGGRSFYGTHLEWPFSHDTFTSPTANPTTGPGASAGINLVDSCVRILAIKARLVIGVRHSVSHRIRSHT